MTEPNIFVTIAQRLPELDALHHDPSGLRSPSLAPSGGSPNRERVPFRLASRLDYPEDGPAGIRTSAGVRAWASFYALAIADERGERVMATALGYLASVTDWASASYVGWDDVLDEATQVLAYLDRVTGHSPQRDVERACPSCGGGLTRDAHDNGLTDVRTCTHCGEQYADEEIAGAVRRLTIRNTTTDTWVTHDQINDLYPTLDRRTLHAWVQRGHVRKEGKLYSLSDLNARARRLAA